MPDPDRSRSPRLWRLPRALAREPDEPFEAAPRRRAAVVPPERAWPARRVGRAWSFRYRYSWQTLPEAGSP